MEEVVQMTASAARAGVEISVELLKILVPALAKGSVKILGGGGKLLGVGISKAGTAISNARAEGTVSRKNLFAESLREKSPVQSTSSFPSEITEKIVAKAKEYKIPVLVNGSGPQRSLSYLDRDKDIFAQVMQDWQMEQLAPKEGNHGLKNFTVNPENMDAVKTHLENNGVECWFTQANNGDIHCNFFADNEEKVNLLMSDFKNLRSEIEGNCKIDFDVPDVPETERQLEINAQIIEIKQDIEDSRAQASASMEETDEMRNVLFSEISQKEMQIESLQAEYETEKNNAIKSSESKKIIFSDGEKNVEINADSKLRKHDVMTLLREEMGYSPVQAELAANKIGNESGLSESYFAPPSQMDNIAKMQVNIRYGSDDISIRDISFSALKLNDCENVRLNVSNEDKSVLITPAEMSDAELKTLFKEQLGMSDIQAEKSAIKARKIDSQIQSKFRETAYSHDGQQYSVGIERTSNNAFIVRAGEVTKSYDFNQINLEEKISADFGIPRENARNVIKKANNQSVIQNRIRESTEKKRKTAKTKKDPLKTQNAPEAVKR